MKFTWTAGLFALLVAVTSSAQTLPRFPRDDAFLLLEYDRYSTKLRRLDSTPLLRIYGSGRVQVYFSEFAPRAGLYELQLSDSELDALVLELSADGLDQNVSTILAETAEEAAIDRRNRSGELYYSSEITVTLLNMYWVGAGDDPLLVENLQATDQRFPGLPQVSTVAAVERTLLALTEGNLGAPVGPAKTFTPATQP